MHSAFGFDMYFFIWGYRATNWNSNLNIGGTGLTRINFANINNTHKFIETLKYYQQSLSQLTKRATEEEEEAIKKIAGQYIANHDYFDPVWEKLDVSKKFKILEIIASGKGIFPYKKIISSIRTVLWQNWIFQHSKTTKCLFFPEYIKNEKS